MALQSDMAEALDKMLRLVVRAKRDGMMDHREAREVWVKCLTEAGFAPLARLDGSVVRRG